MDSTLQRVLIVDDEPNVLRGFGRALRRHFELDMATSGEQALSMFANSGPYAVVISDMRMPGMDGLDLLSKVRDLSPLTVRIMLTGNTDLQTAMNAVNQGQVFRFLTKPCSSEEMAEVLWEALDEYRKESERDRQLEKAASELRELNDQLSYQACHDFLTGLANRQAFELRLKTALESARLEERTHVICYLDLDNMHVINTSCGTTAGDELLRQVAQLLSAQRRKSDLAARLGGDEFGLLLEDCTLEDAQSMMVDLQASLQNYRFQWGGHTFEIGADIGLLAISGEEGDVATVLSAVETACNVAKDGRSANRMHIGTPQDPHLTQRLNDAHWVERIQKGLQENRFQLYFQGIYPAGPVREEGDHYELLVRLLNEDGEPIPPGAFLPAAEHYHLSPKIDCWVVTAAADWLEHHPERLQRLAMCSINLSGLSLGNQKVLECIHNAFASGVIPREKICFEVTETAAITHLNGAIRFIKALKKEGFRFALDDFGSGLSSFGYLKNMPVDYLKIDGMFVKHMDRDEVDRATVQAINEIGHAMGKKTIAEYVENEEILEYLRELGVDFAQGYLFAAPKPLDEL